MLCGDGSFWKYEKLRHLLDGKLRFFLYCKYVTKIFPPPPLENILCSQPSAMENFCLAYYILCISVLEKSSKFFLHICRAG